MASQKPDPVTVFTQHTLAVYGSLTSYTEILSCGHCSCPCSPVKDMSLHVHYYTSMHVLRLLGLHATVRGAGLHCIRASHAGVYTTGQHRSPCLRPTSWHAHTVVRDTCVARLASTLHCWCTRAGKAAKGGLSC